MRGLEVGVELVVNFSIEQYSSKPKRVGPLLLQFRFWPAIRERQGASRRCTAKTGGKRLAAHILRPIQPLRARTSDCSPLACASSLYCLALLRRTLGRRICTTRVNC